MVKVVDKGGMRPFVIPFLILAGCAKPNPNLCCTDEADCAAEHLPSDMTCDEGKVCRGHVCIEESCSTATDCDLSAPFCAGAPDGVCQANCTEDMQCPGAGGQSQQAFCVAGGCVQCRTNPDCSGATPICSSGSCVACNANEQCTTGVCEDSGTCSDASKIAYVDITGSPTSDCTPTAPCSTVERAMALTPPRLYVLISTGTYTRGGALDVRDRHYLIGRGGASRPILDRTDNGPIITTQGAAELHIEHVQLSGATGAIGDEGMPTDGYAVYCRQVSGSPVLSLRDVLVSGNARGVAARQCNVAISDTHFLGMAFGVEFTNTVASIDRSEFAGNDQAMSLDGGIFTITNNIVSRSVGGVSVYSVQSGNRIEFNTFVDTTFGCDMTPATAFPNNLFARSGSNPGGPSCTFPGSIIANTDISALKLKQPDTAPYDYHLLPGSSAIDAANTSTLDHDFDGDARPKGAGRDVGADEAQ